MSKIMVNNIKIQSKLNYFSIFHSQIFEKIAKIFHPLFLTAD